VTDPTVHLIDWRDEFAHLDVFLTERGGVIHVIASDAAPSSTFSKTLRLRMDDPRWPTPWKSIQIDGSNPNTHYIEDIVLQLERSLGVVNSRSGDHVSPAIEVGRDIRARTVEISDVTISYAEDSLTGHGALLSRIDQIGAVIRANADRLRLALIFLDSHKHDESALKRFRSSLWDPVLSQFTDVGLLLVDIGDPDARKTDLWPPAPDHVVDLPERFLGMAIAHARDDLAQIALSDGTFASEAEAQTFAATLLAACDNNVRDLHASVARVLARLTQ
jgi:hypothetical protein